MLRIKLSTDLDLIKRLDAVTFPKEELTDYQLARSTWWVAFLDGEPVGYCGAREIGGDPETVFLSRAAVIESARGQGLQRKLIAKRLAWGRSRGKSWAITYTARDNCASSNNLIRSGFKLYRPEWCWAGTEFLYWKRAL